MFIVFLSLEYKEKTRCPGGGYCVCLKKDKQTRIFKAHESYEGITEERRVQGGQDVLNPIDLT